jgi:hypothetical protein
LNNYDCNDGDARIHDARITPSARCTAP